MRFKQIVENSTTAGSVATVAQPMMTQTRENVNVPGLKPVQKLTKGAKKKNPYANSIAESKVTEDDLAEQDLIVIPGQGRLRRTGFVKHDLDQGEHEGHTLKNSLHTIARAASDLDKRLSVQSEFPEWVSEKIGAAKGMMVTVMDYLISSQEMQHGAMESASGLAYEDSDGGEQIPQMAMGELRNIAKNCKQIHQMLKQGNQLDAWEYSYITVSNDHIGTVADVLATDSAEDVTEGSQRVDSLVTDALRVMKGPEVSDAVLALKRVLGDRAYNERRGFYSFYVDQIHRNWQLPMYGQQDLSEGDVSTGNLQTMYNLARMAKNYCSDPEGTEALTELLRILKWYMDQGSEQGVTEGRVQQLPTQGADYSKYDTDHLKMMLRPGILHRDEARFKTLIRKELQKREQQGQQGVEEGDMYGDAEVSWEKGGRRAPTGAFRNPNFGNVLQKSVNKHNKAIVKTRQDIGSRIADIGAGGKEYNEKTDAAWDAAKKKVSEGLTK